LTSSDGSIFHLIILFLWTDQFTSELQHAGEQNAPATSTPHPNHKRQNLTIKRQIAFERNEHAAATRDWRRMVIVGRATYVKLQGVRL
jgi:hypothetical protein